MHRCAAQPVVPARQLRGPADVAARHRPATAIWIEVRVQMHLIAPLSAAVASRSTPSIAPRREGVRGLCLTRGELDDLGGDFVLADNALPVGELG